MRISRKHIGSLENIMEMLQEKSKAENKELQKKIDNLKIEDSSIALSKTICRRISKKTVFGRKISRGRK